MHPYVLCTGNLGNEALIVTRDDEVFALGSNGAGCLGQGDMHSTLHPKQVEPLCYKVREYLVHPKYVSGATLLQGQRVPSPPQASGATLLQGQRVPP